MEIHIKKEVTEDEFLHYLAECEKKISEIDDKDELISICTSTIKKIIPADIVYIVKVQKKDNDRYILEYENITKTVRLNSIHDTSIIIEALRNQQPLIANDIQISFIYNRKIDNLIIDSDQKLKDLLIVPVIEPEKNEIVAMIWAATYPHNLNQFIQKDMDYMIRFSPIIRKILKKNTLIATKDKKSDKKSNELKECLAIQEKLRKELKYKDLYFSSIIHDVRAPMNALLGFLDLLKLKENDIRKIDYIESAIKSGENIVSLINDALDLAKIQSGKMDINKSEFSPHNELEDSAQIFANAALKKNICFSTYFDPALPEKIVSDPMRIRQIINNLLSNALKFTPDGGSIDLEIIYETQIDGMTVKVKDTGIGIPKDKQDKIFAPFEQESAETSQKYGGTGLGLSIAMQLTILLGGKLQLQSEEGKGSLFYFTIPCNTPTGVKATYEKNILQSKKIAICQIGKCQNIIDALNRYFEYMTDSLYKIDDLYSDSYDILLVSQDFVIQNKKDILKEVEKGKRVIVFIYDNFMSDKINLDKYIDKLNIPLLPKTILKVINNDTSIDLKNNNTSKIKQIKQKLAGKIALTADDNPINLKFMKELLKSLGMKMIPVSDGDKAIKEYVKHHNYIDIILIDENMDNINGSEAIEAIREYEKNINLPHVTIIGLTGDSMVQTKDKMIKAGADDVLVKPVRLDTLIEKLEAYLLKNNK